jgi:oleate hydratase
MRAHIVGGGFGGLAAAALLIRNAGVSGPDITIYEADERLGGGFFLGGSAESGYNLPGSVFDKEFRCTFDLLKSIPSASNPSISVTEEFLAFNTGEPYHDRAHIFDRNGRIVHGPRFGLSLGDGLSLARVVLTPEAMLDGRRIEEFFSQQFFSTEFWLLWSTIMGSLPQHSAIEFRRYMNRFLYLFGDLSDMTGVMRTPINQNQAFIEPLVAWLRPRGVNFLTGAFVQDIGFAPSPGRTTVDRLDYERSGAATSVAVAPEDLVLVTTGSQAADLSAGSMTEAPSPRPRVLQVKTEVHESGYLLITVEDTGIGIDPENLNRIFDPFFTTKPHGMGMGLSICRSIIENHDGRLAVSAGQPYGSIFYVFLPIDPSVRNNETASDAPKPSTVAVISTH